VDNAAYTAFGEFLGGSTDRRYGFAGAWQYQSHPGTGFPYLHVGHRYYDPATGRFLQRDPIGIGGGFNVYAYVGGRPTLRVDPSGLQDPGCDIRSNFWAKCYLEGDFEKGDDIVEAQAAGCAIGAAGVLLCVGGARAAPVVWGAARSGLRGALRWGNRGFFRVGRSVPPGKGPVCSIRWGEKHLDLFKLPKWLDDLYK
jgi:RHS repeat-associated protein